MKGSDYYSEEDHGPHEYFELGEFRLGAEHTLPRARLSYKTHGTLNKAKDNAILFPHMYSGTPKAMEQFIGNGRPLDPEKYFIILPGQFGNGFSSSPSNTPPPFNQGAFPNVTIADDVQAQHRLVTEQFGISELQLVLGWSMGAAQTYEWAVRYPDMVKRAAPIAGTAQTTPHNHMFVRMHENAIKSDSHWNKGFYDHQSDVKNGLRRHAEVFSVMGVCPQFYKQEIWRSLGFETLDAFNEGFWQTWFGSMDPNNLLCMGRKWRHSDVSLGIKGGLEEALARIKAKTLVIAFANDMFFPQEDCAAEVRLIPDGNLQVVDTLWAHFAMFCFSDGDKQALDAHIGDLLGTRV